MDGRKRSFKKKIQEPLKLITSKTAKRPTNEISLLILQSILLPFTMCGVIKAHNLNEIFMNREVAI